MCFEGVVVLVRLARLLLVQDVQELAVDLGLAFEALLGGRGRTRAFPNVPETPHHRSLTTQANKTNRPHPLPKKKRRRRKKRAELTLILATYLTAWLNSMVGFFGGSGSMT